MYDIVTLVGALHTCKSFVTQYSVSGEAARVSWWAETATLVQGEIDAAGGPGYLLGEPIADAFAERIRLFIKGHRAEMVERGVVRAERAEVALALRQAGVAHALRQSRRRMASTVN